MPTPSRVPRNSDSRMFRNTRGLEGSVGGNGRIQHGDVGLRGLRFHAALAVALQGGIIDALGIFQVARQQGGFFALLFQSQHFGFLPLERGAQFVETLARRAGSGTDTTRGGVEFSGEFDLVAVHLGLQAHGIRDG